MNKQEIYQYLDENNIPYERTEHKAVFSMEELKAISILYPECEAKNLFVRDDKKLKKQRFTSNLHHLMQN